MSTTTVTQEPAKNEQLCFKHLRFSDTPLKEQLMDNCKPGRIQPVKYGIEFPETANVPHTPRRWKDQE